MENYMRFNRIYLPVLSGIGLLILTAMFSAPAHAYVEVVTPPVGVGYSTGYYPGGAYYGGGTYRGGVYRGGSYYHGGAYRGYHGNAYRHGVYHRGYHHGIHHRR